MIAQPAGVDVSDPDFRRRLFAEYGEFMSSLRGAYVGAEDSGA